MNNGNDPSEEFRRKMEQFKGEFGKSGRYFVIGIVFLVAIMGVTSTFYTVQPDEQAVVIRLGRYLGTYMPGLHFKLPFGIDRKIIVKTGRVHQAEFGFRTTNASYRRTEYSRANYDAESLMLTGDLNVAIVEWVVLYKVVDPFKFLFQARNPVQNVRDVAESIMRRVVGDRLVNSVLTTGRTEIATSARTLMQKVIDKYDIGITIISIKLQDVNPPDIVKASFNEVNEAKQEQEKVINQAERAYNRVIPEARGKAEEVIARAEGYAGALLNRAKGDVEKFRAVLVEYRRAPNITRKRIYIETMQEIFSKFEKLTIVDSKVKGLLPIFNKNISN